MKMKRRVKERGRRMTRKAERRTEGRGKGERRKRGNEGKNNKDGRREKEKEERSGKSGAGGSKHSMGEGSPYLGAWEREAALCPCHPSPTPPHHAAGQRHSSQPIKCLPLGFRLAGCVYTVYTS